MIGPRGRRGIDALDVALDEVPVAERDELAERLRSDARLRRDVERLAPVVARLERQPADTWDAPEPPPLAVGAPQPVRPRRWPVAFVLRPPVALALSALFVLAGIGLGSVLNGGRPAEPSRPTTAEAERRALIALPGEFGTAELVRAGDGRVTLDARGLAPDRQGYHELWLLPAEGRGKPVPVGRFRVGADGRATATLRLPTDPDRFALYDVSEEPDDGNPAHSGRSILRASTS